MNLILKEILPIQNWENQFTLYARKNLLNSLNSKLINQENFENFQNFIEAIVQKGPRKSKKRWVSNQRRILHILLNCISVINSRPVQQFKNEEILRINRVFPYKDKYSVQYQLKKLSTNNKQNRRRWSQEEEIFLQDIVKKTQNKNKWNEIARQLFINSKGEYFRQGKHCRERFYKLKGCKGQISLSEEIQSQLDSEQQNSLQFHSHHSAKQQENSRKEHQVLQNERNANFTNFNVQKYGDYNQKPIQSSLHQQIPVLKVQESVKLKKCSPRKQKSTKQSIEDDSDNFNNSQSLKHDQRKTSSGFQPLQEVNPSPKMEIEEKQNLKVARMPTGQLANQQMIIPEVMYTPFTLNFQNNQIQNQNGTMGQIWFNSINYWPMGAFPFNFQGFY